MPGRNQSVQPELGIALKIVEAVHVWLPLAAGIVLMLLDSGWYSAVLGVVISVGGLVAFGLRRRRPQDDLRIVKG